jgi:hypothetical protein
VTSSGGGGGAAVNALPGRRHAASKLAWEVRAGARKGRYAAASRGDSRVQRLTRPRARRRPRSESRHSYHSQRRCARTWRPTTHSHRPPGRDSDSHPIRRMSF